MIFWILSLFGVDSQSLQLGDHLRQNSQLKVVERNPLSEGRNGGAGGMLTVSFVMRSYERLFHRLVDLEQTPLCARPANVIVSCVEIAPGLSAPALGLLFVWPRDIFVMGPKVVGIVGSGESLSTISVLPGLLLPLLIEVAEI